MRRYVLLLIVKGSCPRFDSGCRLFSQSHVQAQSQEGARESVAWRRTDEPGLRRSTGSGKRTPRSASTRTRANPPLRTWPRSVVVPPLVALPSSVKSFSFCRPSFSSPSPSPSPSPSSSVARKTRAPSRKTPLRVTTTSTGTSVGNGSGASDSRIAAR